MSDSQPITKYIPPMFRGRRDNIKSPSIQENNSTLNSRSCLVMKPVFDITSFILSCMTDNFYNVKEKLKKLFYEYGKENVKNILNIHYKTFYYIERKVKYTKYKKYCLHAYYIIQNEKYLLDGSIIQHLLLHGQITNNKFKIFNLLIEYGANIKLNISKINMKIITSMSKHLRNGEALVKNFKGKRIQRYIQKYSACSFNISIPDTIADMIFEFIDYSFISHKKRFKEALIDLTLTYSCMYCGNKTKICSKNNPFAIKHEGKYYVYNNYCHR